jgi:hypothetical protein
MYGQEAAFYKVTYHSNVDGERHAMLCATVCDKNDIETTVKGIVKWFESSLPEAMVVGIKNISWSGCVLQDDES